MVYSPSSSCSVTRKSDKDRWRVNELKFFVRVRERKTKTTRVAVVVVVVICFNLERLSHKFHLAERQQCDTRIDFCARTFLRVVSSPPFFGVAVHHVSVAATACGVCVRRRRTNWSTLVLLPPLAEEYLRAV